MFVYSGIHNWQQNDGVKQILVFSNQELKDIFDHDFSARVEEKGIAYASDSKLGALYKIRAVKNGYGNWIPKIWCGDHSGILWEGIPTIHYMHAFKDAIKYMYLSILMIDKSLHIKNGSYYVVGTDNYLDVLVEHVMSTMKETENYEFSKTMTPT